MSFTIGIDYGGVLSIHDGGDAEHKTTDANMEGAIDGVANLKKAGHHLNIISFCGMRRAVATKHSVDSSGLSEFFDNQYYVGNRDHKKYICKYLGCDFMIDDREAILNDVLKYNPGIVTILFQTKPATKCLRKTYPHILASNWENVVEIINGKIGTHSKVPEDSSVDFVKYCHPL